MIKYEIYDVQKPILDLNTVIEAETPSRAVREYLNSNGEHNCKITVSGGNSVRISATPFYIKDGKKYKYHTKRVVWFNVTN